LYVYSGEIFDGKLREVFNSLNYLIYGVGGVFINLVSIGYNDYRFYLVINLVSLFLSLFGYLYFIETPFYYFQKNNAKKLYQTLVKIASRNYQKSELPKIKNNLFIELTNQNISDETKNHIGQNLNKNNEKNFKSESNPDSLKYF
jgi:uncharacterized protein YihD (DUF1040 family)